MFPCLIFQDCYQPTGDLFGKGGFSTVLAVVERGTGAVFAAKRVKTPRTPPPPRLLLPLSPFLSQPKQQTRMRARRPTSHAR